MEIKPFKIRDVWIKPPLILSPMAGVTDISFRRLLKRRGGVGLTVSEFISVEGLTRNNPKSKRQMRFFEEERPFAVQIFGGQPERMRMAAEMAEEVGADILDINCGCPAPKVVKHGGGSGLLRDYARLENILKEIKRAIRIPLTIKIRAGYYDHTINAVETARLAESCGVEHIALHGRTKEQGYKGLANWDLVKQIKEVVKVPVSGSGDVVSVEGAFEKWREDMPDMAAIGKMKQLAGQFTKGLQGGALFRTTIYHSHSVTEILDRISEYFEAVTTGRPYYGEAKPEEIQEAPELNSCEAATVD